MSISLHLADGLLSLGVKATSTLINVTHNHLLLVFPRAWLGTMILRVKRRRSTKVRTISDGCDVMQLTVRPRGSMKTQVLIVRALFRITITAAPTTICILPDPPLTTIFRMSRHPVLKILHVQTLRIVFSARCGLKFSFSPRCPASHPVA